MHDGEYSYTYDNEGNRLTRSKSGNHTDYEWDHRNRLVKVTTRPSAGASPTKVVEHEYDAFDQWVRRKVTVGSSVSNRFFLYHDGQIQLEFDSTNRFNLDKRYLWGPGVDQLLAQEDTTNFWTEGETSWALTDHLGTVRDLVDDAGNYRSHIEYDSFGNVLDETHWNASGQVVTSGPGVIETIFGYTEGHLKKRRNHSRMSTVGMTPRSVGG